MASSSNWRQSRQTSSYKPSYSSQSAKSKQYQSKSNDEYRPSKGRPFQTLAKTDQRVMAPGRFDLRPNGELCLDTMRRSPPTKDAYVDPLTLMWSVKRAILAKYMEFCGLKSINHSESIVWAMRNFEHWKGDHLSLDDGKIYHQPAEPGQYMYSDDSLHFYSNESEKLVEVARISYFRHINVGDYYQGMRPQPSLSTDEPLSYINREKNYMFLGRNVGKDIEPYFAMDNEASYSVSDGMRANQMTDLLKKFIQPGGMVIDMTACVGGNTIAFADSFFVRSQEIDSLRYTLLRYNCMVAGVPLNRYLVWCVDSLALFDQKGVYQSDCVYCDPPWGGPEYAELEEMELSLGPMNLIDIALNSLRETKVFMCRTTFNYNRSRFNQMMDENGYMVYTYVTYKKNDRSRPLFYLLFVVKKGFKPINNVRDRVPSMFEYIED